MNNSILVLFGATGDLAFRKIYPAVYNLMLNGLLPAQFHLSALGRRSYDTDQFRAMIKDQLVSVLSPSRSGELDRFLELVTYHQVDFHSKEDYLKLGDQLHQIEKEKKTGPNRLFYLAVMPELFAVISQNIAENGLKPDKSEGWSRLVVEKPFGSDLKSASVYNRALRKHFLEEEILRTDHYLGKEMIRNITTLRFSNPLFASVWNHKFIDHIQIEVNEEIGIDKRAGYFDQSGMMRDMLQSHILQILALVAMEPPDALTPREIIEKKIEVLKRMKPVKRSDIVIGQYKESSDQSLKGYRDEKGVSKDSTTETFVALKTFIKSSRFHKLPIYIRTAKRMPTRSAQIIVVFKDNKKSKKLFPDFKKRSNILVMLVQPREGAAFCFNSKEAGSDEVVRVVMDYCHNCRIDVRSPEAYEKIIEEAIAGNLDIFTGWDEIYHEWKFADRIQKLTADREKALKFYEAGSWGPDEADQLIKKDGRRWIQLDL